MARVKNFLRSPLGRRALMYLAPVVVGWILKKLQGGSSKRSDPRK